MVTFGKVDTSIIELKKRVIKFFEFGAKTASESMPFGIDSSPIKGMVAIHSKTSNDGESVIIGYINRNQISESGETRIFSVDGSGELKAFVFCKKDGKLLLNGDAFSAVRFENLNTAIGELDQSINTELQKIQTAITTLGGTYAPDTIITDLSNSKSEDVKLK